MKNYFTIETRHSDKKNCDYTVVLLHVPVGDRETVITIFAGNRTADIELALLRQQNAERSK